MSMLQNTFKCSRLNLLIVDDDQQLIKFFKIYFSRVFASVYVLESAQDAPEFVQQHRVHLILSDYEMPRYNGLWLLKELRSQKVTTPFLMLSGAPLRPEVEASIHALADGYMRKPIEIDELQKFIACGLEKYQALKSAKVAPLKPKKKAARKTAVGTNAGYNNGGKRKVAQ